MPWTCFSLSAAIFSLSHNLIVVDRRHHCRILRALALVHTRKKTKQRHRSRLPRLESAPQLWQQFAEKVELTFSMFFFSFFFLSSVSVSVVVVVVVADPIIVIIIIIMCHERFCVCVFELWRQNHTTNRLPQIFT